MTEPTVSEIIDAADAELMELIAECSSEFDASAELPTVFWTSEGTSDANEG
jgi:hypothetical protein